MTFSLPYPPSANRIARIGKRGLYVSNEVEGYKRAARLKLLTMRLKPFEGDVSVGLRFYRPQRSGDLDNRIKVLLDSMNRIAFVDDSQVVRIVAERYEDKVNPRVEVEIEEMGAD